MKQRKCYKNIKKIMEILQNMCYNCIQEVEVCNYSIKSYLTH